MEPLNVVFEVCQLQVTDWNAVESVLVELWRVGEQQKLPKKWNETLLNSGLKDWRFQTYTRTSGVCFIMRIHLQSLRTWTTPSSSKVPNVGSKGWVVWPNPSWPGVAPAWEDAAFKNGGRWVIKLEKVKVWPWEQGPFSCSSEVF